jgi:hypothetical protein
LAAGTFFLAGVPGLGAAVLAVLAMVG